MNKILTRPSGGAVTHVQVSAGEELVFTFDPGSASLGREGDGLVFSTPDGQIVLDGFFAEGAEDLPAFTMPDGLTISGGDLLASMDAEDLLTAMGASSSPPTSGAGEYGDDPGALLSGLDKYGKLGTDYWGRETEQGDEPLAVNPEATAFAAPASFVPGGPPEQPGGPGEPGGPVETAEVNYNVLFLIDASSSVNDWNVARRPEGVAKMFENIKEFCEGLMGNADNVNVNVMLFGGNSKSVFGGAGSEAGFTFDGTQESLDAGLAELYRQIADADNPDSFLNRVTTDAKNWSDTTNFQVAFDQAANLLSGQESWKSDDYENKVFFITDASPTAGHTDTGGAGWAHGYGYAPKDNAARDEGDAARYDTWTGYDTSGNKMEGLGDEWGNHSTQSAIATSNDVVTIDGKRTHFNEYQDAVESFRDFLENVQDALGQPVDVHALGIRTGAFNHASDGAGLRLMQSMLSLFDNTGVTTLGDLQNADGTPKYGPDDVSAMITEKYGDWGFFTDPESGDSYWVLLNGSIGGMANVLILDSSAEFMGNATSTYGFDGVGKQLLNTLLGEEYTQHYMDSGTGTKDMADNTQQYADFEGNGVFLTGQYSNVVIGGDGDNIVYAGKYSNVELTGDGDNYIKTAYDGLVTVRTGDGNNVLDFGNTSSTEATTGAGNDTFYLGYGKNIIDAGAGDDHVYLQDAANSRLTLGEGEDVLHMQFSFRNLQMVNEEGTGTTLTKGLFSTTNTVTDFNVNEDKLDLSELVGGLSANRDGDPANDISLEDYLDQGLVNVRVSGDNVHVTFNHDSEGLYKAGTVDGVWGYRAQGEAQGGAELVLEGVADQWQVDANTDQDQLLTLIKSICE